MLESTVDLLNGLFLIAMILLIAVCIVGSTVAALRAVSRNASADSIQEKFVDGVGSQSGGLLDTKAIVNKAAGSRLAMSAPEDFKSRASPQTPTVGVIPIGTYRS